MTRDRLRTLKSESHSGKEIVDLVLDRLRKLADNCTGLQGTWIACGLERDLEIYRPFDQEEPRQSFEKREDFEAMSFNACDSGAGVACFLDLALSVLLSLHLLVRQG